LIAAAESASRRSAHETAMERYRRALVLMADYPQTSLDEYSRVRIGLGQTLKLKGEFDEASQVLIEAVDRLREAVRVSPQWVVNLIEALKELADVRQREGALAKAVAHLEAALDHWERLNPQEDLRLWYA